MAVAELQHLTAAPPYLQLQHHQFVPAGDVSVFLNDDGLHGLELWMTDGTAAGTQLVKDIIPGDVHGAKGIKTDVVAFQGLGYFVVRQEDRWQLWATDGTASGTQVVVERSFDWPEAFFNLFADEDRLYVQAAQVNAQNAAVVLLVTDGTAGGTRQVTTDTGGALPRIDRFADWEGQRYFTTQNGDSWVVWQLDGPAGIARQLKAFTADNVFVDVIDEHLIFRVTDDATTGFWHHDGVQTRLFVEVAGNDVQLRLLIERQGYLAMYYTRQVGTDSTELWSAHVMTDSANPAPKKIATFQSTPQYTDLAPRLHLYNLGGKALVYVEPPGGNHQLWTVNDGGELVLLQELPFQTLVDRIYDPHAVQLIARGERLLIGYSDRIILGNDATTLALRELWVTDGTTSGTLQLRQFAEDAPFLDNIVPLQIVGGKVFFQAREEATGRELWTTDGTVDGTRLIQDVVPGSSNSLLSRVSADDDSWYFTALRGTEEILYRLDSTLDPLTTLGVVQSNSPFPRPASPNDVNGDGAITPLDALLILMHLNGPPVTPIDRILAMDVSGDGYITPLDALMILIELNANPSTGPAIDAPWVVPPADVSSASSHTDQMTALWWLNDNDDES